MRDTLSNIIKMKTNQSDHNYLGEMIKAVAESFSRPYRSNLI